MIVEKMRRTIDQYGMLNRGDRVVVGVSGGADSVALTHLLYEIRDEWEMVLIVFHLDHLFRGEESKREGKFVKNMALELGLPFELRTFDVPAAKKGSGKSYQEVARDIRYRFYEEIYRKYRANRIALGHNADDQAESVLMRLIQGTGTRGLRGISPVRGDCYIRPLIEISREEIEGYLNKRNIKFVNDSSNKKEIYLRNKIRLRLLPLLGEYNPRIKESLLRLSSIVRQEDDYLEKAVDQAALEVLLQRGDDFITLDILHFIALDGALQFRLLRKLLETFPGNLRGINFLHIQAIIDMISHKAVNQSIDLPRGIKVIKEYNELTLRAKGIRPTSPFLYTIGEPVTVLKLREIDRMMIFTIQRGRPDAEWNDFTNNIAHFDLDKIRFPLTVRNFRKGDRFQPLGMRGRKKVKDYFISQKIPLKKRSQIPLLLSGEEIIWLVTYRINNRVKVEDATKNVLRVECIPIDGR